MLKSLNWKPFAAALVSVFIMVAIQKSGVTSSFITNNKNLADPSTKVQAIDQVLPKLLNYENTFELKKPSTIITSAYAGAEYDSAAAYAVVDFDTGEVILSKNLDKQLRIASVTKIMTSIVALDLATPSELFTVTETASKAIPTRLALTPGEKMSVEELINAALLTSANDCAQLLQEGIDTKYGDKIFIDAMNEKAKFLGLKNSHFTNPQGFDNKYHYSSVEDVAILTRYAMTNYPLIAEVAKKEFEELEATPDHKYHWLNNWNGLVGVYPGAIGLKIGNTGEAGHTTSVVVEREGKKLIAVLLGAPGVLERDYWTSQILDAAFDKVGVKAANITEEDLRAKYKTFKYFN